MKLRQEQVYGVPATFREVFLCNRTLRLEKNDVRFVCTCPSDSTFLGDDEDFTKNVVLFLRPLSFWKSLLEVEAEADSALDLQSIPLLPMASLESKVTPTPDSHGPSLSLSSLCTLNSERLVCVERILNHWHLTGVPETSEKVSLALKARLSWPNGLGAALNLGFLHIYP